MADAHREWHTNSGVPMGTPGCPQDACHPYDEYDGDDEYDPLTPEELAQFDAWAAEEERRREEDALFVAATQADDGIPF